MIDNYRTLTNTIHNRLNPEMLGSFEKTIQDELKSVSYSDVLQFVKIAMTAVSEEYTQRSKEAGDGVKMHLKKELENVSYEYQGSVMTNTHIKGYSDIDLLVLNEKFYTLDTLNVSRYLEESTLREGLNVSSIGKLTREKETASYIGNALQDLRDLRLNSERILARVYSDSDISKPKCIKISNKHFIRDVDIVIASWYDDVISVVNDKGLFRGVQVYNKDDNKRELADYPFLSIQRINNRGNETSDRLKKMIRFLKNVKASSGQDIALSSFDINAICYDIPVSDYNSFTSPELVSVIYAHLLRICSDTDYSNRVISVDGREYIFRHNSSKLDNTRKLLLEVSQIIKDLQKTNVLA